MRPRNGFSSNPQIGHGCILELLNKKLENQKWVSRRGTVLSSFTTKAASLEETCKWMSVESCLSWLQEVKPRCECVGPLIVAGLPNEFAQTRELQIPSTLP
ncbi:hypothetical protein ABKV19_012583 [Rosa sericea]